MASREITFSLSEKENRTLENWLKKHEPKCRKANRGAVRTGLTYVFTQTSIGVFKKVVCSCKAEIDVTDYDSI